MKTCCKCKVEKQISEFQKNKTKKDGLQTYCKICKSEIFKEYSRNNKEIVLGAQRRWRSENKERIKNYQAEYVFENLKMYRERGALEAADLTDNYIYRLLVDHTGLKRIDIPYQFIEAKRLQLKIFRKLKELKA